MKAKLGQQKRLFKFSFCLFFALFFLLPIIPWAQEEESVTLNEPSPDCIGSDALVDLTWESTITGNPDYYVLRKLQGEPDTSYAQIGGPTKETYYTDDNVDSDKNYTYKIRAEKGIEIFESNPATTPFAAYCPPVLLAPTTSCQLDGPYIHLSWSPVSGNLAIYELYRDGPDGLTIFSTPTTILDDGPDIAGKSTYNYFVRAIWQDGTFKDSSPIISQDAPACPPTLNTATSCLSDIDPGGPQVSLSWNNLLGVQSYQIYRKAQTEPGFSLLIGDLTETSYADKLVKTLSNTYHQGGQVSYYVKAIWATAQRDSGPPQQRDIPRCPPFLRVESNCDEFSFRLSWTATKDATHYNIYRIEDNRFLGQVFGTTNTSYIAYLDLSICPGEVCTYTYQVKAIVGVDTLPSNSVTESIDCSTIVPPSPPPVLEEPEAYCVSGNSIIKISWSPSDNVTYYTIYRNGKPIRNILETSYNDGEIQSGYDYIYQIRAWGKEETHADSEPSQTITAVDCTPPSTPVLDLAKGCDVGKPYIDLSWSETTNTLSYDIYRGPSATNLVLQRTFEQGSLEFSLRAWRDTGVSVSTTYYYKVVANGPQGVSPSQSNVKSITTPSCLPTTPILTLSRACEAGQPVVNLSWTTDGANTTRYEIFRQPSPVNPIKTIYNLAEKTWQDKTVSPETTYSYKVEAVGYLETQRATQGYKSITTYNCQAPGPFTLNNPNLYCRGPYPRAELTWTQSSNADSYDVYRYGPNPEVLVDKTSPFTDKGSGKALNFDGVNDYVNSPASSSLTEAALHYTVEVWIKPQVDNDYWTGVIGKPGRNYNIWLGDSNNSAGGYIHHRFRTTAGSNDGCPNTPSGSIPMNEWSHVVITNDGTRCRTYINGAIRAERSFTATLLADSTSLYIGTSLDGGGWAYFRGLIDEPRIYNKALSLTEVQEHYQGIYADDPQLRGLWHLDEGSGQIASDSSNYGNNGILGISTGVDSLDPVWVVNGVQTGTPYTWQVKAKSPGGETPSNETNSTSITCAPAKPGLSLTPLCQVGLPAVELSWSYSINATSIEISREGASNPIKIINSFDPEFSTRRWTDNNGGLGFSPETTYTYWVKAIGSTGLNTDSDHRPITAVGCALPTRPENLTAYFSCSGSYPKVELFWDASQNTSYYSVYRNGAWRGNTSLTTYTENYPWVVVNTPYVYSVRAYGPGGGSPPPDPFVDITTDYCPPSSPSIISLNTECENLAPINNIAWSDDTPFNTTSYEIYRDSTAIPPVKIVNKGEPEFSTRNWKDNLGLSPLTSYTYWVKTVGPAGESPFSSSKSIQTYSCGVVPGTPTLNLDDISCVANSPQATLNWNTVPNAYSYNLYRTNPDTSVSTYSTRIPPFTDKGSSSLKLDGSDDYVDCGNQAPLKVIGNMSIEFWAKPFSVSSGRQNPICKAYGGEFCLTMETNGSLSYYHGACGGMCDPYMGFGTGNMFANNTWVHVVITREMGARTMRSYKNGAFVTSTTWTSDRDPVVSSYSLKIGAGYVNRFNGIIDGVRVYGRALKPAEIQEHYQGIYKNEADLRGVWHFDEGEGQTVYDSSDFGNNGAFSGGVADWQQPSDATFYIEPLERERTYKYRVKAFGPDTESLFSNEVSVDTPSCKPYKQENFTVTPKCEGENPQLLLEWELDPEDLTEYWTIYKRRLDEATFSHLINVSPPTISYLDNNVESGMGYEYYITAWGGGEDTDPVFNNEVAPFCYEPPYGGTMPPITVTPQCYGYSSRIKIGWETDITGNTISYNIWEKNITLGETDFSQIASGLSAETTQFSDIVEEENTYVYKVEAVGAGVGNTVFSDLSNEVAALSCSNLPPQPPSLFLYFPPISTGDRVAVSLYWTDAGNEESYKLFRRSSEWVEIAELPGEDDPTATIHYVDNKVVDNQDYEYQVFAYNVNAPEGVASNILPVSIPIAIPGSFTLSGTWVEGTVILLTWTEAATTEAGGPVTYSVVRDDSDAFDSPIDICTIVCEQIPCDKPLECYDNNPTWLESYYKAVATNNGGTSESIYRIGPPLPEWREIAPW